MSRPNSDKSSLVDNEKTTPAPTSPADTKNLNTDQAHKPDLTNETTSLPTSDLEFGSPPKASPPAHFNPQDNPDGGVQAWLCALGGFCVLFCSFGWINAIGEFTAYYETHQLSHLAPSTTAWIASLMLFFMFAGGPVIGKIYDNYGPRWLLLIGMVLHVFGIMMTSLCSQYWQFLLAQGVVSPIGASMIFYPAMSTISTWFFRRRGMAFGIVASGSSLGGVVFPIMIQRLIVEVGFAWAIRISGFLILALMIVANLTVKSRVPPFKQPWSGMDFVRPLQEIPFDLVSRTISMPSTGGRTRKLTKHQQVSFGSFLFFLGMFLPINYIILEAEHYGMKPSLAQYMVPILNAASLFGRTIPGFLSDKIGRFNMMIIMCFFTAILILATWLPSTTNAPIIVFAALFGFGSGAFVSLAPSLIAQISDVRQIGVRTGTLFAIISLAALISNPIGGALITRWNGSYTGLQIYGGVMTVAGSVFIMSARVKLAGWKVSIKV
ncbi:hypothetical protein LTR62_006609 [Meristemomyces frigidus]|uniref:Major facilitator superfamily (MFS) profile domain-containing protein n=1 Tax=Meristemomyces frigidus TaxID=1508187 RepID=A0AAN7TNL7_9PEZI|nr:hypothetical protein LTR62_006609 [Meristemomyces frigidus]